MDRAPDRQRDWEEPDFDFYWDGMLRFPRHLRFGPDSYLRQEQKYSRPQRVLKKLVKRLTWTIQSLVSRGMSIAAARRSLAGQFMPWVDKKRKENPLRPAHSSQSGGASGLRSQISELFDNGVPYSTAEGFERRRTDRNQIEGRREARRFHPYRIL